MKQKEKCDLCNSSNFKVLMNLKNQALTSDRRFVKTSLKKIQCQKCGLVFGKVDFNKINPKDYEKKYSYNPSAKGDTVFFTKKGNKERSSHTFDWILENIPKREIERAQIIVEVGCGQGNLLEKFSKKFKTKKIIGFELNKNAIKIGRKKGLDIRNLNELKKIKADIIISYAVIEHTPSPKKFLAELKNSINPNGIIVIGQPHQNSIYYDIFFVDHLFHFASKHLEDYGKLVGLKQIKKTIGKWPVETFSLHIFKKSKKSSTKKIQFRKSKVKQSINYYQKIFNKINRCLEKLGEGNPLAVFGLGEMFSLFYHYTNLKNANIRYGIDDFPPENQRFSFSVISSKKSKTLGNGLPILFCINRNYYDIVSRKIGKRENLIFPLKK